MHFFIFLFLSDTCKNIYSGFESVSFFSLGFNIHGVDGLHHCQTAMKLTVSVFILLLLFGKLINYVVLLYSIHLYPITFRYSLCIRASSQYI